MIDGRGLLNVCLWYQESCKADAESSFLLAIPLSADASVKNILTPLISGGRVVLTSATLYDSPALLRTIAEHDVTSINCTPSLFYPIVQLSARDGYTSLASLKQLLPGGEATYLPKLRNWLLNPQSSCTLINAYGPTECSDVCAYHTAERQEIETSNSMPIGIPVRNGRLYILDSNFRLQPIGVAGELCYAGDGLARGYLNKSDLTAERFVPNPFSSGGRLYRTGDRARWRADGKLEFLGRMDAQTKVRGFRVELSEIEAALAQHSSIKHCAVMVHETAPNDKRIAAYLVFHKGAGPGVNEIRAFLRRRLPEHMVPAYFIELDEMPLSANRKVDYHALPAPTVEASLRDNEFVAPRDALEEVFAEIWSTVLKVPRVGMTDNFFAIGGHSLTATQIVSQIRDIFEVELPLAQIFERPTIAGLIELFSSDAEVNERIRSRAKIIRQLASIPDVEVEAMLIRESLSAKAAEEQRK
jgi:fengycin family lipopeptide synthetase D